MKHILLSDEFEYFFFSVISIFLSVYFKYLPYAAVINENVKSLVLCVCEGFCLMYKAIAGHY